MASPLLDKVTLFTTCKPFAGAAAIAQNNAIASWKALGVRIVLIGDDEGTAEAAQAFDTLWIPEVERSETGTPRVNSVFDQAASHTDTSILAYVNADIILPPDFAGALEAIVKMDMAKSPFLFTCRRRNLPLVEPLASHENWVKHLNEIDRDFGSWDLANAIDVFVFSRGLFDPIPPFSIGRMSWDNWLLWRARDRGAAIIDGSQATAVFHPIHGYTDHAGGWQQVAFGPEASDNRQLSEGQGLDLDQATTHVMVDDFHVRVMDALEAEKLSSMCRPNPAREFKAGLAYISGTLMSERVSTILDTLRTLLWRNERYFSVWADYSESKATLEAGLTQATDKLSGNDVEGGLAIVQDLLGAPLLKHLRSSTKPLYVWGAGEAGIRVLDWLGRHNIAVAGVLDSNKALSGRSLRRVEIVPAARIETFDPESVNILIASMYLEEITQTLSRHGFQRGKSVYA